MEKLVGDRVRAIGVSNFNIAKLEKLAKTQKIVPAVNQVSKIKEKKGIYIYADGTYRLNCILSYPKMNWSNTVMITVLLVSYWKLLEKE